MHRHDGQALLEGSRTGYLQASRVLEALCLQFCQADGVLQILLGYYIYSAPNYTAVRVHCASLSLSSIPHLVFIIAKPAGQSHGPASPRTHISKDACNSSLHTGGSFSCKTKGLDGLSLQAGPHLLKGACSCFLCDVLRYLFPLFIYLHKCIMKNITHVLGTAAACSGCPGSGFVLMI